MSWEINDASFYKGETKLLAFSELGEPIDIRFFYDLATQYYRVRATNIDTNYTVGYNLPGETSLGETLSYISIIVALVGSLSETCYPVSLCGEFSL